MCVTTRSRLGDHGRYHALHKAMRTKILRPKDFEPHPDEASTISALMETQSRYQLNPRGKVWHISTGHPFTDDHVDLLRHFTSLISFAKGSVLREDLNLTDIGVKRLAAISSMAAVMIENCPQISDAIFDYISGNHRIRWLCLNCPNLTDKGMGCVGEMTHLLRLALIGSAVTESSVPYLSKLVNLRHLSLKECDFSSEAIESLRTHLPNCKIDSS